MTDSDFLDRKIQHGFAHLDADGDGVLTEQDHVLMGQRTARAHGLEAGSPAEQKLIEAYLGIWRSQHLPYVPDGADGISREQFLESKRAFAAEPSGAQEIFGPLAQTFLEIADLDGSGDLGPDEFLLFQRGHFPEFSQADADEAFRHLDRDGDGRLSVGEFTQAMIEYWQSTDPDAPGNWWAGPLN